ncbi:MAG: tetratricopeptide repeat protein, partial [Desulfocapsaceae bacterium]|nr:tetratricopeptide repeat protein [Desulfocapsaceae bacterium]
FGCINFNKERDFLKKFCLSVITFMKNKGFRRIHCGCSGLDKGVTDKNARAGRVVLGQAWTALHAACRRGPFGFCDYESLAHPEYFPLNHESRSVRSKLQRRWKNSHCHSLVYFVPDYKQVKEVADLVVRFFGNHEYVVSEKGFFVIRCDSTAEDSRQWAEELISRITSEQGNGLSLSAGISGYPFQDYTKTEIIRNCQKAILHAEFFGYGSVAVFDALSLNISGDVYYGEGDLAGAVREYRQGLKIDAANINLLNSLGVTYALMNRAIEARQLFQKVLELEPSNFMALYNRGLGEQANLDYATAASCFLAAFEAFDPDDSDEPGLLTDLFYQLGTVYFCNGEYEKALEWLEKWYEQQDDSRGRGKCCCPIGISYYKLGQTNKAMTWLQRALAFAEDDAEALSILGSLYLAEKEGNDIALKLMEKSLELESGSRQFMLRYARGLNECGRYTEAAAVLSECLASRKFKAAAWLELSLSFKGLKKYNKMRYYLNKILGNGSVLPEIKEKAKALYSEMIAETG